MHRIKLDKKTPAIRDFVRSLPLEADGVELELQGQVVCKVIRPSQLSDAEKCDLLAKVRSQIQRSHQRNKELSARTIARMVDEAVTSVRERRRQ
jgi:hypothetical protein